MIAKLAILGLELNVPSISPIQRALSTYSFRWLTLILLAVLSVLASWEPLNGNDDFWIHAAVGRWIVENGRVPDHALFLWTDHAPWIAHSWGSELFFYGIMAVGGESAGPTLALLATGIIVAICSCLLGLLWIQRGGSAFFLLLFGSTALWLANSRFQPRPELFSLLLTVVLFICLDRWTGSDSDAAVSPRQWVIRALKAGTLFVVWANVHGLVVIGFTLLICWAAIEAGVRWQKQGIRSSLGPIIVLAVALLGTFLNPKGPALWTVLQFAKSSPISGIELIDEFKPPFSHSYWQQPEHWLPLLLLLLTAVLAYYFSTRRRLVHLVWLAATSALFCTAMRHSATLIFTLFFVMAANGLSAASLWGVLRDRFQRKSPPPGLRVFAWVAACGVWAMWMIWFDPRSFFAPAVTSYTPRRLCNFLLERNLPGPIFNSYDNSSYIAWRLQEKKERRYGLFTHMLNESPLLAAVYQEVMLQTGNTQEMLDQEIRTVISDMPGITRPGTWVAIEVRLAYQREKWAVVYFNEDGVIWVRRTPETAALIAATEEHLPPEMFLPKYRPGEPQFGIPFRKVFPPGTFPSNTILPGEAKP